MSASSYTGVAYAEYAHLGGARRTEATGLGTAAMFAGVMVMPSAFGAAAAVSGGLTVPYTAVAVHCALAAVRWPAEAAMAGGHSTNSSAVFIAAAAGTMMRRASAATPATPLARNTAPASRSERTRIESSAM